MARLKVFKKAPDNYPTTHNLDDELRVILDEYIETVRIKKIEFAFIKEVNRSLIVRGIPTICFTIITIIISALISYFLVIRDATYSIYTHGT